MPFFKLRDAFEEVKSAYGAKDTAIAGAKLVGKTVFNVGKLVIDETIKSTERTSGKMLQREDLTDEQREKLEHNHKKAKMLRIRGEIKELDHKISELQIKINEENFSNTEEYNIREEIRSLQHDKEKLERQMEEL